MSRNVNPLKKANVLVRLRAAARTGVKSPGWVMAAVTSVPPTNRPPIQKNVGPLFHYTTATLQSSSSPYSIYPGNIHITTTLVISVLPPPLLVISSFISTYTNDYHHCHHPFPLPPPSTATMAMMIMATSYLTPLDDDDDADPQSSSPY